MKDRNNGHLGPVLAAIFVLSALLGACGTDSPTGNTVTTRNGISSGSTATVGLELCTSCHPAATADWMASRHANVEPIGNLYSEGNPTLGYAGFSAASCAGCHDPQGDSGQLLAGYTGNVPRPVVGCESCHGGGKDHVADGGVGPIGYATESAGTITGSISSLSVSAQFLTCTRCHELLDPNDPVSSATTTAAHDPLGIDPLTSGESITDTHFATPGDWIGPPNGRTNTVDITGYAMDFSSETVCTDCHNPHGNADINREWAKSGHANKDYKAPWAHYNWSTLPACQRCHTTTGFADYADALEQGNLAAAESMRLGTQVSRITSTPGWKPEMLKCNGCHKDNRGSLRNPGAYRATYTIGAAPNANVIYQYPNLGTSNVCMTCHSGRNSGKAVNALNTGPTATVDFGNFAYSNVDGHYLTAAGTMFKGTGYEYAGRSYANPDSFKHYQIGTAAVPNTGSDGPCVSCHMYRTGLPGNHLFEPVTDVSGNITNVSSEVCYNCHAGSSTALAAMVDQEKKNYEDALSALGDRLAALGYYYIPEYPVSGLGSFPYIFTTPTLTEPQTDCATQNIPAVNLQTGGTTSCTGTPSACTCTGNDDGIPGTGKNNLGAAFNMSLLSHEPGAYVHNSRYIKRLIYDSIDWLDDGVLNYSVGDLLVSDCTSTPQPWCAGAESYLLFGAQNTAAERP